MDTRPITFFHQGVVRSIEGAPITRTVLEWLREDARCTGTKEGCAEGDCGACTVVVAELAAVDDTPAVGGLSLRTVNSCIQLLPSLDGKALLTVEDCKRIAGGALHPVQQALVECHGSQCGFCTPGFVMTMTAVYEQQQAAGERPTRQQLADALSGNLCRCTGYRPILDAGERMFDLPVVRLDTAPIVEALQALRAAPPLHYAAPSAAGDHVGRFHAPRTLEDFAALRMARPEARVLAGATDIGLWITKQFKPLPELIAIGEVAELKRVEPLAGGLRIGAAVPLEAAWRALVGEVPSLEEVWLRFASPPVRWAGTLVGNLANGSPIGDCAPVLMSLGATLLLRRGAVQRRLALEDFYLGYMRHALAPGEFIEAVEVSLPSPTTQVRAWKLSKRFDSDISALCAGLALTLDGARVSAARFAFGGMAAVVRRAAQAEAAVVGQPWTEATAQAAAMALAADFAPLTDLRASAGYRLKAAGNLLRRLWLETRPDAPLTAQQTQVWPLRVPASTALAKDPA